MLADQYVYIADKDEWVLLESDRSNVTTYRYRTIYNPGADYIVEPTQLPIKSMTAACRSGAGRTTVTGRFVSESESSPEVERAVEYAAGNLARRRYPIHGDFMLTSLFYPGAGVSDAVRPAFPNPAYDVMRAFAECRRAIGRECPTISPPEWRDGAGLRGQFRVMPEIRGIFPSARRMLDWSV